MLCMLLPHLVVCRILYFLQLTPDWRDGLCPAFYSPFSFFGWGGGGGVGVGFSSLEFVSNCGTHDYLKSIQSVAC